MASRKAVNPMPAQAPATPAANPEPILTIEDIADRLKFENTRTVYESTRESYRRPMPATRAGKVLRFTGPTSHGGCAARMLHERTRKISGATAQIRTGDPHVMSVVL